jgi:hypothetical protein
VRKQDIHTPVHPKVALGSTFQRFESHDERGVLRIFRILMDFIVAGLFQQLLVFSVDIIIGRVGEASPSTSHETRPASWVPGYLLQNL